MLDSRRLVLLKVLLLAPSRTSKVYGIKADEASKIMCFFPFPTLPFLARLGQRAPV